MRWLRRVPNRVDRVIIVAVAAVGVLLPWAVALGVKLHLQALGKPTWPWPDIGAYAIFFGPLLTPVAAAPLLALAVLYRRWAISALPRFSRATPLQARMVLVGGFAGGAAGMVHVFVGLFWEFDPMVLWFLPEAVVLCLPWLAGGLAAGALLAVVAGRSSSRGDGGRRHRGEAERPGVLGSTSRSRRRPAGGLHPEPRGIPRRGAHPGGG